MRRALTTVAFLLGAFRLEAADAPGKRVETVLFKSPSMGAVLPYDVVLPPDYASSVGTRYPVLYLLHGLSDHHGAWTTRTNLVDHASRYRLIIVTPEGNNGWYTDSATIPSARYGSYLLDELVPDVQKRYRTIEEGYARGIAGLSMGGYGALKLALSHPDEFAFAASLSGALNAARYDGEGRPRLAARVGDDPRRFRSHRQRHPCGQRPLCARPRAPRGTSRAEAVSLRRVRNGRRLLAENLAFARLLAEKKIAHEYRHLPGVHNWELWDQQIQEVLKVSAQKMPRR